MSDNFGVTPLGKHGGKRPGAGRPRKGETREKNQNHRVSSKNQYGSSYAYITSRLARDGRHDLLEGIRNGKISAFAAGCEAGYCKRPAPRGNGSQNQARARDWAMHKLLNPPRPDPKALIG
jgi:hypothetical protein